MTSHACKCQDARASPSAPPVPELEEPRNLISCTGQAVALALSLPRASKPLKPLGPSPETPR